MSTIQDILKTSTHQLKYHSDSAQLDCELLLAHVLRQDRTYLYTWPDKALTPEHVKNFNALLQRRCLGEPVAHILGKREFWSLNLKVTQDTLIPRPDTERLVELALERIPSNEEWKILDLGTGTGAIAIALAIERPQCRVTATDQSVEALEVAKENAASHQVNNMQFVQSDWFTNIKPQAFNIIVSNPPYICDNDPHLQQGDVKFEPLSALTAGADGLDDIRTIVKEAKPYLATGGMLFIEHGFDQANKVIEIFESSGYTQIQSFTDYGGNPRVSVAIAPICGQIK